MADYHNPTEPRDDRRWLIAATALALMVRLFHLGHESLWVDELMTYGMSGSKEGYSLWYIFYVNVHGPLHAFVVMLFRLISDGDAWVRMPSALAGTVTIPLAFFWFRRMIGRSGAWVAVGLLVLHPLHVHYSQEARNYAFLVLFATLAHLMFQRWIDDEHPRAHWHYALSMVGALLSNLTATFLILCHIIVYIRRVGLRPARLVKPAKVAVLVLVLTSPWVVQVASIIDPAPLLTPKLPGEVATEEKLRGETTFTPAAVPYAAYVFSVGFTLGPSTSELHETPAMAEVIRRHGLSVAWVGFLYGGLLFWGLNVLARDRRRLFELLIYGLVPLVCILALNWQNAKVFNVRYVLVALLPFLALVGAGAAGLRQPVRTIALTLLVATTGLALSNYYFASRYYKEDVRAAIHHVEASSEPNECVLAPTVLIVAEHYASSDRAVFNVFRRPWVSQEKVEEQLQPLFARCNSFWYLRARPWANDPDGYLLSRLRAECDVLETKEFQGVTLFRMSPKKSRE